MGPARPGLVGNALASLAVVALVAVVALGLPLLDRSLSASRTVAAGVRIAVGGGVSVVPPPGATLDVSRTRPGDRRGTTLFVLGPIRYAVVVAPYSGTLAEATTRLREQIGGRPATRWPPTTVRCAPTPASTVGPAATTRPAVRVSTRYSSTTIASSRSPSAGRTMPCNRLCPPWKLAFVASRSPHSRDHTPPSRPGSDPHRAGLGLADSPSVARAGGSADRGMRGDWSRYCSRRTPGIRSPPRWPASCSCCTPCRS